ncbi:hypothetical protein Q1695_004925 [Nippostrongylus brasiliensis]|nr:hypothetical protein Q1695_004925 [Nippostrongylus brasiliensis]
MVKFLLYEIPERIATKIQENALVVCRLPLHRVLCVSARLQPSVNGTCDCAPTRTYGGIQMHPATVRSTLKFSPQGFRRMLSSNIP